MNWDVCDAIPVLSKVSSLTVGKGHLLDCPDKRFAHVAESVASISTGQGEKWTFGRRRAGKAPRAFPVATHQLSQRSTPSIRSLMPLMAQLSEALSRRTL